jgi:hypothetical protein
MFLAPGNQVFVQLQTETKGSPVDRAASWYLRNGSFVVMGDRALVDYDYAVCLSYTLRIVGL